MLYGAMNFPIKPVLEEIEQISKLGFDYLELTMDAPEAHYGIILKQKEAILRALDRHKMQLLCHLPTFVSTADLTDGLREASLKEVLKSLDVAAQLGALKTVLHPSTVKGLSVFVKDRSREYATKSLEAIVERADRHQIALCIENMFPQYYALVNPEDFLDVFTRFPTLKLTLDTGHGHVESSGRKRTMDFIRTFPDRIYHVHANDNLGKSDDHLPIGAGIIDFPEVVKGLKGIGYDETITLEVFSRDRDYLKLSRDKLAAMFATL